MTDSDKLAKKIAESGLKLSFIADKIGISYGSLKNKMSNTTQFRQKEIADLCDLLNINTLKEKDAIFFAK